MARGPQGLPVSTHCPRSSGTDRGVWSLGWVKGPRVLCELGHLSRSQQRSVCLFPGGDVGRDHPYFQGPSALTTFLGLFHHGPTVLSRDLWSHSWALTLAYCVNTEGWTRASESSNGLFNTWCNSPYEAYSWGVGFNWSWAAQLACHQMTGRSCVGQGPRCWVGPCGVMGRPVVCSQMELGLNLDAFANCVVSVSSRSS